jgi:hypothetical protein
MTRIPSPSRVEMGGTQAALRLGVSPGLARPALRLHPPPADETSPTGTRGTGSELIDVPRRSERRSGGSAFHVAFLDHQDELFNGVLSPYQLKPDHTSLPSRIMSFRYFFDLVNAT